ncbi:hypothetical protein [Corynebacterium sp. A21]|uniref:hypothetical protein n=1 Tax=Corynebacterium sp. A21 TaxID=3457318 RepID=UPI003FD22AB0
MSTTRDRVAGNVGPKRKASNVASESDVTKTGVESTFRNDDSAKTLKKLTIQIDIDLHKSLKLVAAQEGLTMREIIEDQLYKYVNSKLGK